MIDEVKALLACTRDVPNCQSTHVQDCSDVVNLSVYFDGTGNNKDADDSKKRWSNIARMYESAVRRKSATNHVVYVAGIGTKLDYPKRSSFAAAMQDSSVLGGGLGFGADARIGYGRDGVEDGIRQAFDAFASRSEATAQGEETSCKAQGEGDVASAIGKHRLIKVINFYLFGFSRGASLARAFANDLVANCIKDKDGGSLYKREGGEPNPMRIVFMGLFDTVASFGAPAANLNTNIRLGIPNEVEQCVHFTAAHELRFSFPLELAQSAAGAAPNVRETVYPGVHSDVGGGYEPSGPGDAQGITNNTARIPMRDMMQEAVCSGSPMVSYTDLAVDPKVKALFDERYAIAPETQAAYSAYMGVAGAIGSIQQTVDIHLKALYAVCGTLHRQGQLRQLAPRYKDLVDEMEMRVRSAQPQFGDRERPDMLKQLDPWRVDAWNETAPPAVVNYVARYVHNSKLDVSEPSSYFTPRVLHEPRQT